MRQPSRLHSEALRVLAERVVAGSAPVNVVTENASMKLATLLMETATAAAAAAAVAVPLPPVVDLTEIREALAEINEELGRLCEIREELGAAWDRLDAKPVAQDYSSRLDEVRESLAYVADHMSRPADIEKVELAVQKAMVNAISPELFSQLEARIETKIGAMAIKPARQFRHRILRANADQFAPIVEVITDIIG